MADVAINGLMLDYPYSGTAVYTRNLVRHLIDVPSDLELTVFLRQSSDTQGVQKRRLATPFRHINRGHGLGARLDKLTWEVAALPLASAICRQDLVHFPYFAAPPVTSVPTVVTVHDLIPVILPGYHRSYQSQLYSRFMAWTVRRAQAILTVSEHSKKDIIQILGVPESRVHVTYEAVDDSFMPAAGSPTGVDDKSGLVREKYRLPDRYFLYLGGSERRKNLELLIRAWQSVREHMRARQTKLVIVAHFPPPDALYPDTTRLVRELGLEEDIHFVPRVDEDDKPTLYREALAFCFPSSYEGFGLPPLEAMACSIPVISSNATSLPEVLGDGGLLLAPDDPEEWGEAMVLLADHDGQRRRLGERGRAQARKFSWRTTAEQTIEVYKRVLSA